MIQEQLRDLYELSRVDRKIREIRLRIAHVPTRRQELVGSLTTRENSLSQKKERVAAIEKERRGFEGELQLSQARLAEFQTKVNQIKTNREYQAALKEIAETKKANQEMEDKILQLLAELEQLQPEVSAEEAALKTDQEAVEKELQALTEEEKAIDSEVKSFDDQRVKLHGLIDNRWLAHYERIRGAREDGIAEVSRGSCQGCHMHIPPQLLIEVQKYRSIQTCPSCQRILFFPGEAP